MAQSKTPSLLAHRGRFAALNGQRKWLHCINEVRLCYSPFAELSVAWALLADVPHFHGFRFIIQRVRVAKDQQRPFAALPGSDGPGGLFFAHGFERRVSLDGGRVDGLCVAGDQAPDHTLGEDVVEQALEDRCWEELAGSAHGRVPEQFLIHLVA